MAFEQSASMLAIEQLQLRGVVADQPRAQLLQAGPHAAGVGRQIAGPSGHTSPWPMIPASVCTATTVLSNTRRSCLRDQL